MHIKSLFLAFVASFLLFNNSADASHAAGGDLTYSAINDSIYKVHFVFYRDCSGISELDSFKLCVKNSCDSTKDFSISLFKVIPLSQNGLEINFTCGGVISNCSGWSGVYGGLQAWHYERTIKLIAKCDEWRFGISINYRNTTTNLQAGEHFSEAQLDNLNFTKNNSPTFIQKPTPVSCALNVPYTYNHEAWDADGDSLSYELIPARSIGNCYTSYNNVIYTSPASYLVPVTSTYFSLDSTTGEMKFSATAIGLYTIVVRCNEYRNGRLIGSIMRDMVYGVTSCNTPLPAISIDSVGFNQASYTNSRIKIYADTPTSFCFYGSSASPTASLIMTTDVATAIPGASLANTGQYSAFPRSCLNWRPAPGDTGIRYLRVTVTDTVCDPNSHINIPVTKLIPIEILPARPKAFIPGVGVSTVLGNSQAAIFPNPSTGIIQVKVASKSILTITATDGRHVGNYTLSGAQTIDLSGLADGMYFIKIQDARNGKVHLNEKLVLRK